RRHHRVLRRDGAHAGGRDVQRAAHQGPHRSQGRQAARGQGAVDHRRAPRDRRGPDRRLEGGGPHAAQGRERGDLVAWRREVTVRAAYALIVLLIHGATVVPASAAPSGTTVLTLPRSPAANEAVWLSVRVGVLRRGAKVLVLSDDGAILGAISPFALRPGREAGTYTIPLPDPAVRQGRVAVRLIVEEGGVT